MAARRKKPEVTMDLDYALERLDKEDELALDLETGGLSPWKDPLAVVSLYGPKSNLASVLHVRGILPPRLVEFLSSPRRRILTHNGTGFDYLFLAQAGVDVFAPDLYDTQPVESSLLAAGRNSKGVSLKATAQRHLGVEIDKSLQKSPWMAEELSQAQIDYCVGDIDYLIRIRDKQAAKAKGDPTLERGIALETSIIKPILHIELNGMPISLRELSKYLAAQQDRVEQAERQLREWFGQDINLRSHIQLKKAIFERYGFELESTDKEHLFFLQDFGGEIAEAARTLLDWKQGARPLTMYDADWVAEHVYQGRVHCKMWQCGTETGRMSSSDPNMQQIPRNMRHIFGHVDGSKFVRGDYSQIEIRVIAAYCNDEALLAAIMAEGGIHRGVASELLSIPVSEINDDQKKLAKAVSFNLLFGGGAPKLYRYARQQGSAFTLPQARAMVRTFFERFTGAAQLKSQAYALTSPGRFVIELPSLRRAISGPSCIGTTFLDTLAQGTAAAGLKYALRECHKSNIDQYLVGVVHDELDSIIAEDSAKDLEEEKEQCMLRGMAKVTAAPLEVEMTVTDSWAA